MLAMPPSRPRWKPTAAEYVTRKVAKELRIPYQHRAIEKRRATRFVKEAISPEQKQQIIQGTMSASHPEHIEGKRILLMDDLTKSGATADEAIRALRESNPAWIGFLVWTIAGKKKQPLE
jgi:predicted amidophosphoribosyltransferase